MERRELTPRYTVRLHKKARKGLQALSGNRKEEAEKILNEFLPFSPLERVAGKSKKLRGAYERLGYFQYDLPDGYRLQYRVDEAAKVVYVDYLGPHP